jgi:uncharacterized metal-binding protein YceD (DUF177 family)
MTDHSAQPDAPPQPLDWPVDIKSIPASGFDFARTASEAERAALATALDLLSCDKLVVHGRIRGTAGDTYWFKGTLEADVVQACVVTLAPVHDTIQTTIAVEFVPPEQAQAAASVVHLDDTSEVEPIEQDALAIGRVAFEELAAALNPYPRRPGAEYAAPAPSADTDNAPNPFAVLARLKAANKDEPD